MKTKLTFARDVNASEWVALPKDFDKGATVFRFTGHTYGLDRDDLMYAGRETVPCTLTQEADNFFTVPVEFLLTEDGVAPEGSYKKFG